MCYYAAIIRIEQSNNQFILIAHCKFQVLVQSMIRKIFIERIRSIDTEK